MTKPVSTYTPAQTATKPTQPKSKKLNRVGGLVFSPAVNQDCVAVENKNGKRYYSVTLPEDVKVEYYEQKGNANIRYVGGPGGIWTEGTNLNGVTIKGSPKEHDRIRLFGESKNNTIIVNNENIFNIGTSDIIYLDKDTKNNKVHLGINDNLYINTYTDLTNLLEQERKEAKKKGEYVPVFHDTTELRVEGRGVSEQEAQLRSSLSTKQYSEHKAKQAKY